MLINFTSTICINGKCKINATTNDILKIQKVNGSTLYDSLELSSNTVAKTSIFRIDTIDILASLSSKASASNVHSKQEITDFDIAFANSLNNKAEKSNT